MKLKRYLLLGRKAMTTLESESYSVVSDSFVTPWTIQPWNSPGKNTGVGSLSLLRELWRSNPGLLHCRQILYQLSHKISPSILEWVAYPFSSGTSWPRNWTRVSCITGRFFTNWAIREDHDKPWQHIKKQRYHFVDKGLFGQSYGFSSSHVQMWELDHKEGWMLKNWSAGVDSWESLR